VHAIRQALQKGAKLLIDGDLVDFEKLSSVTISKTDVTKEVALRARQDAVWANIERG
jgi:hypothetical protein